MTSTVPELMMAPRGRARLLSVPVAVLLIAATALGQPLQPLKPPDRTSPRAALETFLQSGDAFAEFAARDYLPAPSRSGYEQLELLGARRNRSLDLSGVPPAAQAKTGYAAANALYEVLSRIPLPAPEPVPGAEVTNAVGNAAVQRWVIPNTEIALIRVKTGSQAGEFLFSADTVARADEFYERVRGLPYVRPVPLRDLPGLVSTAGGWMIPYSWIQSLPASLRAPIAGQAGWKWIGLAVLLGTLGLVLSIVYRLNRLGDRLNPVRRGVVRLAMPLAVLLAMPAVEHLALVQLVLVESVGSAVELAVTAVTVLASAWLAWRVAGVVAEVIVASPRYGPESLDAHIVRGGVQLVGVVAAAALLALGANRVGLPLVGIVAGLGVGGLAVALAAQPTIENLIAGISLVGDKAVRIGEYCQYGDAQGTVEAVGIRSTRIRGDDRTLTNMPNAILAKMPIVSLTRRDRILIKTVLGLRYESTPDQLRSVLGMVRELLKAHPRVDPATARVRFVEFGESSLDIEVYAHVTTTDRVEFLGIQEDILLRVMDIIEQGGTSLAFPSRTLYLGRDRSHRPDNTPAATTSGHQ
jgi:MscS family membrane protein